MIQQISDMKDPRNPLGKTWYEMNMEIQHEFQVGQLVEEINTGVRMFVAKQTRDCDGTPLYTLTPDKDDYEQDTSGFANRNWHSGYNGDNLRLVLPFRGVGF